MERFVGYRGESIVSIGDQRSSGSILVGAELSSISNQELINDFLVKNGKIVHRKPKLNNSEIRIAVIGVWKIQCGISTYTEYLVDELSKLVKECKVFAEISDTEDGVHRCWKRGEPLSGLIKAVNDYDPDIVMIQHEYGIFPDAKYWLSLVAGLKCSRIFTALHSVYRHKDKAVCEAVIPNIIVHTDIAKEVLVNEKKVAAKISVIPHGCLPPTDQSKLWNIYRSKHTFMQFGFGFEYKGWENSIATCAELKKRYKDVFFTGVFSESSFSKNLHDKYYQKLQLLIDELDVRDNVAIIRGFQSEEILDCILRTNNCMVLPYVDNKEHQVFAVTGAARLAMRSGIPVVTSSVPFFYDLKGICPQADTPQDLAVEIEKIWQNPGDQVKRQNEFLLTNSWKNIASKYLETMSGD